MKSGTDRILIGIIVVLAGVLAWVIYPTLEQHIVAAGDPAPEFKVTTDSGKTISPKDFGGKLLVVNFWASWCGPCIDEAPSMEAFTRDFAKQGVVVLGVSIDRNDKLYKRFLKDYDVSFETMRDPDWVINTSFGTFQFPETYIIDRSGRVVEKIVAAQNWMDPAFRARIKAML